MHLDELLDRSNILDIPPPFWGGRRAKRAGWGSNATARGSPAPHPTARRFAPGGRPPLKGRYFTASVAALFFTCDKTCASCRARQRAGPSARLDGNGLDLDQEFWMRQPPYLDCGAGRECRTKVLHPHVDVPEEFIDIRGECLSANEIGQCASAAASAALRFSPTWRICRAMSPRPTISPSRSRARRPEMNISRPGTTVTTGA